MVGFVRKHEKRRVVPVHRLHFAMVCITLYSYCYFNVSLGHSVFDVRMVVDVILFLRVAAMVIYSINLAYIVILLACVE